MRVTATVRVRTVLMMLSHENGNDAIQRIRNGTLDFTVFPLMECVRKDGKTYSLSNRRLYVARVLHIMGVLAEVQIDLLPFEHARVHRVKDGKTKWERVFSTRNMGVSVLVKSQYKHLLTASLPTSDCAYACDEGSRYSPGA